MFRLRASGTSSKGGCGAGDFLGGRGSGMVPPCLPRMSEAGNADGWWSYVTLGRHSDLSEEEILAAEDQLHAQGLSGWLAIMEGNRYAGRTPSLIEVRPLAGPVTSFANAATACVAAVLERRAGG